MKRAGVNDNKDYTKKCEEQRRESFVFHNVEGARQRLETEENDANDLCENNDRYELKRKGESDTEEYKKNCEEQRRESFGFCNNEGRRQRLGKEENDAIDHCEKHDSYDKREEQRRESFVFRNVEGARQRLETEENDANDLCEKNNRYELKWKSESDIEEYKKNCEEQRRESFVFCNNEGRRQRLGKEENLSLIHI